VAATDPAKEPHEIEIEKSRDSHEMPILSD
jgi:hypothetical protein